MSAFTRAPVELRDCDKVFKGNKKVRIVLFGNVSFTTTSDWWGANIAIFHFSLNPLWSYVHIKLFLDYFRNRRHWHSTFHHFFSCVDRWHMLECNLVTLFLLEGCYQLGLCGPWCIMGVFHFLWDNLCRGKVKNCRCLGGNCSINNCNVHWDRRGLSFIIIEESQRLDATIDPFTLRTEILLPFWKSRKLYHLWNRQWTTTPLVEFHALRHTLICSGTYLRHVGKLG